MLLTTLTLAVFLSILADNLLLTVVVPILPEFLREKASLAVTSRISGLDPNHDKGQVEVGGVTPLNSTTSRTSPASTEPRPTGGSVDHVNAYCLKELFHLQMLDEDSKLGLLFSTKAIVQLISNPLVGKFTVRFGYNVPLSMGNALLCFCALAFGFADSYILLLIGRSCHGLASALVTISGMALIAEVYPVDADRTVCMGRAMGAAALGVLIGYPFGGFFYALLGKLCTFLVVAALALLNCGLCGYHLQVKPDPNSRTLRRIVSGDDPPIPPVNVAGCWALLRDRSIMVISLAIWFSTTAIAVLEPTLPVWLIETIDPPKWELGLVFVPDSIGYFIGTTFFGSVALNLGRWRTSMISMGSIGVACLLLPFGHAIWHLAFPHFVLGLGLGIVDASMMPLLAWVADARHKANYGSVYAVAQTSVALAYSLGPLLAGQLVRLVGFPDLIRSVGFLNLAYSPFLLLLKDHTEDQGHQRAEDELSSPTSSSLDQSVFASGAKKVRFHFHLNLEKFPLKPILGREYCSEGLARNQYERFRDELDSD